MAEIRKKTTLPWLFKKKEEGKPIAMLTCYDFPTAFLDEKAGVDIILVGDSLGMTMLGYNSTLPVTMDDMVRHAQAVRRGAPNTWLVVDMPYMSYQPSVETAVRSAGRFMAETECDAVKLEGGAEMADRVSALVSVGIPVMGHLGLTPQSASALGGYRLQGKTAEAGRRIVKDARVLEDAGVFAMVIEVVPYQVCQLVSANAKGPIIISQGSGPHADGQLHLSRHVWLVPALQAAHGKGLRQRGPSNRRRPAELRERSERASIPSIRELVLDGGRGIPATGQSFGNTEHPRMKALGNPS